MDDESKQILSARYDKCSNWMLFEDHPLLCYEPDKNYPKIMLDESGKLKYRKITFQNLVQLNMDGMNI